MNDTHDTLYKEHILELYRNPENYRPLLNSTHTYREHNPLCGDDLTLYLIIKDATIIDASFTGEGCAISKASASLLTEHLKNKTIADLRALTHQHVQDILGVQLGPVRLKCALLPLAAAQHALEAP